MARALLLLLPTDGTHVLPAGEVTLLTAAQRAALQTAVQRDMRRTLQAVPDAEVREVNDEAALGRLLSGARYTPERMVIACRPLLPTLTRTDVQAAVDAVAASAKVVVLPTDAGRIGLVAARADDWPWERVAAWMDGAVTTAGEDGVLLPSLPGVEDDAAIVRLAQTLMDDPELHAPATRNVLRQFDFTDERVLGTTPRWPVTQQEVLFGNARRTAVRDHAQTYSGATIDYPYFLTPDAVRIVAVTVDAQVVLVRQYRLPIRNWSLEIPAGGVEADRDIDLLEAAARELQEEVGGQSAVWRLMGGFPSSTAHLRHYGHVVLALDVTLGGEDALEATEDLVVVTVPLDEALDMARYGELGDAESALALLICEPAIREHLA